MPLSLAAPARGALAKQLRWVYDIAKQRGDAEFELVDIADFNLPLLDEPIPPSQGQYSQPHTIAWAGRRHLPGRPDFII